MPCVLRFTKVSLGFCMQDDRDLRVDFVRGIALLIIFSDHVIGNPVRDFMPISLGFSDMAEVFVFLSGYLNGLRRPAAAFVSGTKARRGKTLTRCLKLFGAILLIHVLKSKLGHPP